MLRILHITSDEKFFDRVFDVLNSESFLNNEAIVLSAPNDSELKWIKNKNRNNIHIVTNEVEIEKYLQDGAYDVVYFHSLPLNWWRYVKFIPNDKIIIWWAWGYDVYNRDKYDAFIPINLFMPFTKKFEDKRNGVLKKLHIFLCHFFNEKSHRQLSSYVLNRINYIQTVTRVEFLLMRKYTKIEAKQFFFKEISCCHFDIKQKRPNGSILLGNSGTSTNNHVDVLYQVSKYRQIDQKIIMPLSYGGDKDYLSWLDNKIECFENIEVLSDFLPPKEYEVLMDECSYLCIGSLRQQAMGNIYYALRNGIKVFLYRDSIIYKELSVLGYVIFTIDDVDENSFKTPLTEDQMRINVNKFDFDMQNRSDVFYKCMREIEGTINSNNMSV